MMDRFISRQVVASPSSDGCSAIEAACCGMPKQHYRSASVEPGTAVDIVNGGSEKKGPGVTFRKEKGRCCGAVQCRVVSMDGSVASSGVTKRCETIVTYALPPVPCSGDYRVRPNRLRQNNSDPPG